MSDSWSMSVGHFTCSAPSSYLLALQKNTKKIFFFVYKNMESENSCEIESSFLNIQLHISAHLIM